MEINSPLQLYKILLRTCKNKKLFKSEKSRKFLHDEIVSSFRKYKNEKNPNALNIQLQRATNFLSVSLD